MKKLILLVFTLCVSAVWESLYAYHPTNPGETTSTDIYVGNYGYYYIVNKSVTYKNKFGAPAAMYTAPRALRESGLSSVYFDKFDENNAHFIFKLIPKADIDDSYIEDGFWGYYAQNVVDGYYLNTGDGNSWYGEVTTCTPERVNAQLLKAHGDGQYWIADETDSSVGRCIRNNGGKRGTVYGWTTFNDNISEPYNVWEFIPVNEEDVANLVDATRAADEAANEAAQAAYAYLATVAPTVAEMTGDDNTLPEQTKAAIQAAYDALVAAQEADKYDITTTAADYVTMKSALEDAIELAQYRTVTYIIDGEIYATQRYKEGELITPPAPPTKDGYVFSGWSTMPDVMGVEDITVNGSFAKLPQYRTVTYIIDGDIYTTQQYKEGEAITPPATPTKNGYVFSGWSTIPDVMGVEDITVNGSFAKLPDDPLYGDVDGKGSVNVNDIIAAYRYINNGVSSGYSKSAADVNGDGDVNSADIVALYNYIVTGEKSSSSIVSNSDNIISVYVGGTDNINKVPVTVCLNNPSVELTAFEASLEIYAAPGGVVADESVEGSVQKFLFNNNRAVVDDTNRWEEYHSGVYSKGSAEHGANSMFISIVNQYSNPFTGNEGPIITVFFDASEFAEGDYVVTMKDAISITGGIDGITYTSPDKDATFSVRNGRVIGTGEQLTLATNISLDHEVLSLNLGDSQKLSASIIPSEALQDVTWTSSDTNVATVSQNGVVTATGKGQARITATTIDGSDLSAYCTVSVNNYNSDNLCFRVEELDFWSGGGYVAYVTRSENASGDIVIPDHIEDEIYGYVDVAGIDDGAFAGCTEITSVTIPNYVGFSCTAFTGCTGLKSIIVDDNVRYVRSEDNNCLVNNEATELFLGFDNTVIPNSVTRIGDDAFFGCTGLTSITIPSTVTSIGIGAFEGCTGLTSVKIPTSVTSIGVAAFRGCTGVTSIDIPETITELGHSTFYGCTSLTSIEIPNAVTTIDNSAFKNCTGLTSIEIPNSVTAIGNSAFEGCSDLSSATLGNSVTTIGNSAFKNCSSLASINIPASVTSFGNGIFEGCTSLPVQDGIRYADNYIVEIVDKDRTTYSIKEGTRVVNMEGCANMVSIDLPNSVTEINFKGCTNLASITIPNSVTSIRDNAFQGCTGLMSVTIPNSVKNIGSYAFSGCTGLTSITIPNSVTTMGHNVFSGCTGLSSISLSEALTSVIHYAFRNCTGLTSITIPSTVTSIGIGAFEGCTNLTSMEVMGEEPYRLGEEESIFGDISYYPAFDDYGRVDLIVPLGCADKYKNAEYWKDFRSIREKVIDSDFSYVMDEENDNAAVYGTSDKDATEVEIPSTVEYNGKVYAVTQIAANAFANYENIEQVLISDDVTTVGNAAFEDCTSLEYVVLPAKIEEIGDKAFEGCSAIAEIRTLSTTPPTIEQNTFDEATMRTATLYVPIGSKVLYEQATYWRSFANIVEKDMSDDVTSISNTSIDAQVAVSGIYTLNGSRLNDGSVDSLSKGIYIVRYNDGKSKKMIVK